MDAPQRRLFSDVARERFFLVPNDVTLPDGRFVLTDLTGRDRRRVDEEAAAAYEVDRAKAHAHLKAVASGAIATLGGEIGTLVRRWKQGREPPPWSEAAKRQAEAASKRRAPESAEPPARATREPTSGQPPGPHTPSPAAEPRPGPDEPSGMIGGRPALSAGDGPGPQEPHGPSGETAETRPGLALLADLCGEPPEALRDDPRAVVGALEQLGRELGGLVAGSARGDDEALEAATAKAKALEDKLRAHGIPLREGLDTWPERLRRFVEADDDVDLARAGADALDHAAERIRGLLGEVADRVRGAADAVDRRREPPK